MSRGENLDSPNYEPARQLYPMAFCVPSEIFLGRLDRRLVANVRLARARRNDLAHLSLSLGITGSGRIDLRLEFPHTSQPRFFHSSLVLRIVAHEANPAGSLLVNYADRPFAVTRPPRARSASGDETPPSIFFTAIRIDV